MASAIKANPKQSPARRNGTAKNTPIMVHSARLEPIRELSLLCSVAKPQTSAARTATVKTIMAIRSAIAVGLALISEALSPTTSDDLWTDNMYDADAGDDANEPQDNRPNIGYKGRANFLDQLQDAVKDEQGR